MKTIKLFAAAILALMAVACSSSKVDSEASKETRDLFPTPKQIDSVSYLMGLNFGYTLKGYNFGDLNYAQVVAGMRDMVQSKDDPRSADFGTNFKIDMNLLNDVVNKYLSQRSQYVAALNFDKGKAFLEKNKKAKGVEETPSGLQYIILEEGNDNKPGPADSVYVHYKGTLLDGTVFDQTPEGGNAILMTLNHVIPGWTEGLQLIGEGGKIRLFVPSDLGYGSQGGQTIAPNSTLIFDVDLESVKHAN